VGPLPFPWSGRASCVFPLIGGLVGGILMGVVVFMVHSCSRNFGFEGRTAITQFGRERNEEEREGASWE